MNSYPRARRLDALRLDDIEPATTERQLVGLVDDTLGRPIRVPVLVARGRRDGPVLGLTAALHGNEINGIPVLHRLFARLDLEQLRGTVVGVAVVNVPGLIMNQREFLDGRDLNHVFPGRPDGNVAELYAARLVERVITGFDALLDLHTASFGRVNSLYVRADLEHPETSRLARVLRPEILLHNLASDGTLRGTAMELSIPAVTLEIGNPQRFQERYIRRSVLGVRAAMGELGMVPKRKLAPGPEPIVCTDSRWIYSDSGGLLSVLPEVTDLIQENEPIAVLKSVFGDIVREYRAPYAGVVIGKSVNPVGQAGARILHLGRIANG